MEAALLAAIVAARLVASTTLEALAPWSLRRLDLRGNKLGDEAVDTLGSFAWPQLVALHVPTRGLSAPKHLLAERFGDALV